jgi:hypothetical protein
LGCEGRQKGAFSSNVVKKEAATKTLPLKRSEQQGARVAFSVVLKKENLFLFHSI